MKCIIIDDEPRAIEILARYIARLPELELTASFDRPLEALSFLKVNPPDCIFLDINMPDIDGLQLARFTNRSQIIFTTAYPEHALESYEVNAVDYLLKPVSFDRFLKAIDKLEKQAQLPQTQAQTLAIKSGTRIYRINYDEIEYIETQGNNVIIHTPKENITARMTVSEVLAIPNLVRIHKSFLVPKDKIHIIETHQVVTKSGAKLPIGAVFRNQLDHLKNN